MKKVIIGLVVGMLIGSAGMAAAATTQTVQATLAKFSISIDGKKQSLKSDPLVYKGTTYLPVRDVASMFGADVSNVDNKTKSIELVTKGETSVQSPSEAAVSQIEKGEWISTRDLVDNYNVIVSAAAGSIRDVTFTLGEKSIVFSIPGKLVNSEYISKDGSHKAIVNNGAIYLSKESAAYLGVSI